MSLAMEEKSYQEESDSSVWSYLRALDDEVREYSDSTKDLNNLKGVAKTINDISENGGFRTMALPDRRAIQYAFDAYDYANKDEKLSIRQFSDEEKHAVMNSSIYLKLRKTSALDGSHHNISAVELIDLFNGVVMNSSVF